MFIRRMMPLKSTSRMDSSLVFTVLFAVVNFLIPFCHGASYTRPLTKVISTKYGVVRGLLTQFSSDVRPQLQSVESYLGIPYAAAPTGNLRFMPPTTPSQFEGGVRNATSFGPVCPQTGPNITQMDFEKTVPKSRLEYLRRLSTFLRNQSEDCLYLNIYTPSASREDKDPLPVLVYIHGESYSWGTGNAYDGTILASYGNLVVVTLNYRLGIFGFLNTGDGFARGNYGLMDQVAAIKFVEENVEQFGGDPNNITVMGHGTGAACVNLLMISPVAANYRPLFQRAILLGGSALSPWAISHDSKKYTMDLAQAVKCPVDENSVDLLRCLRNKNPVELLKAKFDVPQFLTGFGPTIDGIFIPDHPRNIMRNYAGLYRKYGLLIGLTHNEAVNILTKTELTAGFDESRQNKLLRSLVRNLYSYHLGEVFMSIKFEYADWERGSRSLQSIRDATLEILNDALTVAPLLEAAQLHAGSMAQQTYMYLFQHAHRLVEDDYPGALDSVQADDLPFLFGAPLAQQNGRYSPWSGNFTPQDAYVTEVMGNFISNFARTGDPRKLSPKRRAPLSDAVRQAVSSSNWPKYDAERQKYLAISARSKDIRDHYRAHKTAFWTELIPKLNIGEGTSIAREHHDLADFDQLDSYEGLVRSMAYLAFPPPPLPPSTTPPPWRNRSRSRATPHTNPSSTQGKDIVVTVVEPESQIAGTSISVNTGIIIGVSVCAVIVIINLLWCVRLHYQRRKLRKQRMQYNTNTSRTPSDEKRNGVPQGTSLTRTDSHTENNSEHVETLLAPSTTESHSGYSKPSTPMPANAALNFRDHSVPGDRERSHRTFNSFQDHRGMQTGSVTGTDMPMPPSLPAPAVLRAMSHLDSHTGEANMNLMRRISAEALRKSAHMVPPSQLLNVDPHNNDNDETAV